MISKSENQIDTRFQKKGQSKIVNGSILQPQGSDLKLVLNFINLKGTVDSPLFPLFDTKWGKVRQDIKSLYSQKTGAYKPGYINQTAVQSDVWVVHLLCQDENLEVDEKGLRTCLKEVCKLAKYERANVIVSSRLSELCEGDSLSRMLSDELSSQGVSVMTYVEPGDVIQVKASTVEELTSPVPVGAKPKAAPKKGKIKRSEA